MGGRGGDGGDRGTGGGGEKGEVGGRRKGGRGLGERALGGRALGGGPQGGGRLGGGVIFGYAGLYKVLAVDERLFVDTCEPSEQLPCEGQRQRLVAAYTLGSAAMSGSSIFLGFALDALGPRWTMAGGALSFSGGLLAMAAAKESSSSLLFPAFLLISIGGPAIFNSMLNFAELIPFYSAAIIAAQNGMFDSSSLVLFLMGKLVEFQHLSLSTILLAYQAVPISLFLAAIFLVADKPYGSASIDNKGELHRVYRIRQNAGVTQRLLGEGEGEGRGEVVKEPEDIYNSDIWNQIKSPLFWTQAVVTAFCILRSSFMIASVNSQIYFIAARQAAAGSSPLEILELTQQYVDIFNWLMPLGGVVMVPVAGYVMVHLGMVTSFITIGVMMSLTTIMQLCYDLPIGFQVVSFTLYALVRPFMFGATTAFIGRIFGFSNFGRLFGLNRLVGALVTLTQYPLTSLAEGRFEGNYFYVNLGFLILELIIAFAFPYYLWKGVFYGFFFRPKHVPEDITEKSPEEASSSA